LIDFTHPKFANIDKTLLVSEIKDEEDGLAAPVIRACYSSESLLACGIPNLELNIFAIHNGSLESEVHTDSCQVVLLKLVFSEPNENG